MSPVLAQHDADHVIQLISLQDTHALAEYLFTSIIGAPRLSTCHPVDLHARFDQMIVMLGSTFAEGEIRSWSLSMRKEATVPACLLRATHYFTVG
jgi:hypothetical protein